MPSLGMTPGKVPSLLRKGKIRIAVMGLGRIGLPTAAMFAKAGALVTGVDIKKKVVDETNAGKCWLTDEPGLADMVKEAVRTGNLRATLAAEEAISRADFAIICVPTPVYETKTPDYSAVQKAARTVGGSLRRGSVVIVESTVGPGVTEEMVGPAVEAESGMKAGKDFGLVSCPERSDPGNIMQNMKSLPRIIGGLGASATDVTVALYESALGVKAIRVSDPKTANAAKLTENLFRDVNIALANEFALLFEELGVDAIEVINACASKYNFMPHYPGIGVGGPCLVGDEFVFVADSIGLHATRIGDYVKSLTELRSGDIENFGQTRILRPKRGVFALSFDGQRSVFRRIQWFSMRPYTGRVVRIRLATNRHVTVTPDHPMIIRTARGLMVRKAADVRPGDEIPLAPAFTPPFLAEETLDLMDELSKSDKLQLSKIKVKPVTWELRQRSRQVRDFLRDGGMTAQEAYEYLRHNYLPLDKYLLLEAKGGIPYGRESLVLYTARGRACRVPAVLRLDEDFWRFVGYYCSEGCVTVEKSLRGLRERIKISFGAHETDLIVDCRNILQSWGIHPDEETANGSHSLKFSSRIFGHFLRDVLGVGTDSYTKQVPPQLFFSTLRNKAAFIQGLFRGDGWLEDGRPRGRMNVTQGFATVSPELFQGALLIMEAFGVTPTCRTIATEKSKVAAQALLVSRYQDLKTVQNDIGGLPKLESAMQSYYHATKKSTTMADYGRVRTAFVRGIEEQDYSGDVFNMEVEGTHTFASSYGIVTHNCLPANSYYLISEGMKSGNIPSLIRMAREINDRMPDHAVELVVEALNEVGKTVKGSRIAILGVAYKPNIKDVQLTPVERVVTRLRAMGAKVEIYDPMFKGEEVFGLKTRSSLEAAVKGADCLVVGTAHDEFKHLDLEELSHLMRRRAGFVDARNVVSPAAVVRAGFAFRGVGRRP